MQDADQELAALKYRLKAWESRFFSQNGRRPIPADIALDPIAKSYRRYETLKKLSKVKASDGSLPASHLSRISSNSSFSKPHLERIRKGFSFLNQTFPISSQSSSNADALPQTSALSMSRSASDSWRVQHDSPIITSDTTHSIASAPVVVDTKVPATTPHRYPSSNFVSPLSSTLLTISKRDLPGSDDDAAHDNECFSIEQTCHPSPQLGELADRFLAAAATEVFVPESSGSDPARPPPSSDPDAKPRTRPSRPARAAVTPDRVESHRSPEIWQERLTLTNNFVKLDLKHGWKGTSSKSRGRSRVWKSAKMYAIEMKKKRAQEHNDALYTELVEDGLRQAQLHDHTSTMQTDHDDNDPAHSHPDFKRRRLETPNLPVQNPAPDASERRSRPLDSLRTCFSRKSAIAALQDGFGFASFRPNQFEVIARIMQKRSTVAVMATGAGKSLLYQMPAYLLPGLCLVVAPLLSLMRDQLGRLPPCVPGAIWSSNESVSQVHQLIGKLRSSQVKVLFVSPERLHTAGFQRVILSLPSPGISFACIDEAHCVSQWSHNFRPAFVRIGHILRSQLDVVCILALTATATKQTLNSVCSILSLNATDAIVADVRRDNLSLSVSRENDRFAALFELLNSDRFRDLHSIIIYVHQQRTADEVMFRLRTQGIDAVSYHAGKDAKTRKLIQEQFMSNKVRIICATIAFGMGLDKCDVGAVIHFNCPQSMEHYVQEIGRAGRDGSPALGHVFYDEDDVDRYRSLAFANGADHSQVLQFLHSVFDGFGESDYRFFVALSCAKQVQAYDLREEVVESFLTFLEFETVTQYVRALPMIHNTCTVRFLKTPEHQLAQVDPILAEIIHQSRCYSGSFSVNIAKVANGVGVAVSDVQRTILTLKSLGQISAVWKDLSFCMEVLERPADLQSLGTDLVQFCRHHESSTHQKVNIVSQILKSVATEKCLDFNPDCQPKLHQMISTYFVCDNDEQLMDEAESALPEFETLRYLCQKQVRPKHLISDIKVFLLQWKHKITTARQVARILHGISSPKFPFKEWCKSPVWGKYISYSFQNVLDDADLVMQCVGKVAVKPGETVSISAESS